MEFEVWAYWQQFRPGQKKHLVIPYRNYWTRSDTLSKQVACGQEYKDPPYPAQKADKCYHCLRILASTES